MKTFDGRPSFSGMTAATVVKWYYDRAWNTMNGAKRAIVARTVDLYIAEIDEEHRTVRFNIPANPDDADGGLVGGASLKADEFAQFVKSRIIEYAIICSRCTHHGGRGHCRSGIAATGEGC